MLVYGAGASWSRLFYPGAAYFTVELEPTLVCWSRSRLLDLGQLEPDSEPGKKVAAPQHWS